MMVVSKVLQDGTGTIDVCAASLDSFLNSIGIITHRSDFLYPIMKCHRELKGPW